MSNFLDILYNALLDALATIIAFLAKNLKNIGRGLNLILPYLMYVIGKTTYEDRGDYSVGGEIIVPLMFLIVIYFLNSIANKIGKGSTIPTPRERFTEVDEEGEVSIRNDRVHEVILYLADLEDWLERKGLL